MVRVNTTLTSLCVLVLAAACAPEGEEPAPVLLQSGAKALGEGPASRVANLGTKAESALVRNPTSLAAAGSSLFFSAGDETIGPELWRLTSDGPVLVSELIPGPQGSSPAQLFHSGGITWFSASEGVSGIELWRTDGTTSGTVRIKDIRPGSASSQPSGFTALNGDVLFSAEDGSVGRELWRTDGTPAGTVLVRDLSLGSGSGDPHSFTEMGGQLYFLATGAGGTRQLWRTDGTPTGTVRVGAGVTAPSAASARGLVRLGRTLFFAGQDASSGLELWKTDGTEAGTVRVKDISPGSAASSPSQLIAFGGAVYFVATDGTRGRELWRTDGTEAGTQLVTEVFPGNNTVETPDTLTATTTHLYFAAKDSAGLPRALHVTDGTASGTRRLANFQELDAIGRGPLLMKELGGTLYFTAYDPFFGYEVWTSNGTAAGTQAIGTNLIPGNRLTNPPPTGFTVVGDTLYFVATAPGTGISDDAPAISTLWRTRGLESNTAPVGAELSPTQGSNPAPMVAWNGALYLTTFETDEVGRLWRSDGTAAGTRTLGNVLPRLGFPLELPLGISSLTPQGDALYFAASTSVLSGYFLTKTKGSGAAETTERVTNDVKLSTEAAFPMELISHEGALYFAGSEVAGSAHGVELWKSDGTAAGTTLVKDIVAGSTGSFPSSFRSLGTQLLFLAEAPGGRELWRTDGTEAGTVRVADIRDQVDNPGLVSLGTVMGGALYFVASEAGTGTELWKTDGLLTTRVRDIAPGAEDASPSRFTEMGGALYFSATDGTSGQELWKTDGTEAGTVRVRDIRAGGQGSAPTALTALGGTLYFTADDGVSGRELWKTDGTEAGTVRVRDILPGAGAGVIAEKLFALSPEGLVLFAANDGENGIELWRTDGTEAGTFLLHDLAPWQLGSQPSGFTLFGDSVVFSANDGRSGREPWRMPRALLANATPPVVSCPSDLFAEAQQPLGASVEFPVATATDDAGPDYPPALAYSPRRGSLFPLGPTSVTATARDAAGLTATCTFTVTVRDTTPPTPVCPSGASAEAERHNGTISAIVTYASATATDTVTRTPTLTYSLPSGSRFPQGDTLVTVTARDEANNTNQCTFTVSVRDTTAATVTCPADQTAEAENPSGASVTWPPAEASDNLSTPVLTYAPAQGSRFALGTTAVVATATDGSGNTSTCTFNVLVRDTKPPTVNCPAPLEVEALGPEGGLAEFTVSNFTDTVSSVTVSTQPASGTTFPLGTTPVRAQARDASGNTAECTFPVTVRDTLPPLLTCPQELRAKGPGAIKLPTPSVRDRVDASPTVTYSPASGSEFALGDTAVVVTATDASGNAAQCTFNVKVEKASGCSSTAGAPGAAGLLGVLAMLALASRRRVR